MNSKLPGFSIDKLLRNVPLFHELDNEDMEPIVQSARREEHKKNTTLMREGDEGDSLFIVLAGMVRIYIDDEDGQEHTLYMSGPESYFGEVALLDGSSRTASAVTTETTTLLRIPRNVFLKSVHQKPDIALHMLSSMTQRLRKATDDIRVLALKSTYQRLALKLIELSEERDGTISLQRNYSQSDLANMIGASREAVSKILKELEQHDFIEKTGKQIVIKRSLPYQLK